MQVCQIWAGASSCYLVMLDGLKKQACKTAHETLAASLEPLALFCSQLKPFL